MLRLICAFIILISFIQGANMRISLSFIEADSKDTESKIIIDLVDNVASRDFYAMLPLRLEFSDYVGKEKISPELPKRLNTQGLNGYDPSVGDFFYFSPWGNLGIFYDKQPFHNGLVPLGRVDKATLAKLKEHKDNFTITIDRAE